MLQKTECTCTKCQAACKKTPGWFRPGEAEYAAAHLNLSLQDFFDRYLGVQWWVAEEPTFVLAPALTSMKPGCEYPGDPRGVCIFFKDERCMIHEVKPHECSHGSACDVQEAEHEQDREETVSLWKEKQTQVRDLLGHEPMTTSFSIFDLLLSDF